MRNKPTLKEIAAEYKHKPHMFVATTSRQARLIPQVNPLQQSYLATYLQDNMLHHPVQLHTQVKAHSDSAVTQNSNTPLWLEFACHSAKNDPATGALT